MSEKTVFAVHAACLRGVEAIPVTVEVSMSAGLPGISIVGMADSTVLEARSRIRCALRSTGFEVPRKSITINLAPGDVRKTGSGLDLPIAVAILALSGQIPTFGIDSALFVGELALDGSVLPVKGEVAYQILARDSSLTLIGGRTDEPLALSGLTRLEMASVSSLRLGIEEGCNAHSKTRREAGGAVRPVLDYEDVVGQEIAKRALVIAAAGEHGLIMIGTPGAGKSMLAQRMCGILPTIDEDELQESLCIHSVAGEPIEELLEGKRPFRSPHHSISAAGLLGGGRPVMPGEASLAHGGVLYLEEMGEWSSHLLQMLRQPIEEGVIRIVRANGAYVFPARFQLLAASNPCPCGYLGDQEVECRCTPLAIERYRTKLSGPLADRIDISIDVMRPAPELIVKGAQGKTTEEMREAVQVGRAFREERTIKARRRGDPEPTASAESAIQSLLLDGEGQSTLLEYARRNALTARGIVRLARVARTVADLAESEFVQSGHVLEAAMFQGRELGGNA